MFMNVLISTFMLLFCQTCLNIYCKKSNELALHMHYDPNGSLTIMRLQPKQTNSNMSFSCRMQLHIFGTHCMRDNVISRVTQFILAFFEMVYDPREKAFLPSLEIV